MTMRTDSITVVPLCPAYIAGEAPRARPIAAFRVRAAAEPEDEGWLYLALDGALTFRVSDADHDLRDRALAAGECFEAPLSHCPPAVIRWVVAEAEDAEEDMRCD